MEDLNIKVVNHQTGEVSELTIRSVEEAKEAYLLFGASKKALEQALDRLKGYLDEFLGNEDKYQFPDGKILRRVQRETKTFRIEDLREVLDEDQLMLVSKVDMSAAKTLVAEMVERRELPAETMGNLMATADVKAQKPFVELR